MFPLRDSIPIHRTPVATYAILAINVIAFLWFLRLPPGQQEQVVHQRGFVPARIHQLADPKPLVIKIEKQEVRQFGPHLVVAPHVEEISLPPDPKQILLSLLTCMFLHGGWWHLIGNMWYLWIFGDNIEDRLGTVPFVLFYLLGGMLASGAHYLTDPASVRPVIGASGAVAVMLGAYAITWPWARVETLVFIVIFVTIIELPALAVLGIWFVIQLLAGLGATNVNMSGGVAIWAHVGGFVAGAVLMPILSSFVDLFRPPPEAPIEAEVVDDAW